MNSQALGNLGAAERELGELQAAIGHMEAGIAMLRQLGQPANYAGDLVDLTIAYLRAGKLPDARRASEEMLALLDNSSADAMPQPQSMLWAAARTYRALGDSARAQALLRAGTRRASNKSRGDPRCPVAVDLPRTHFQPRAAGRLPKRRLAQA